MTTEIIVGIITGVCGIVASLLTGFLTANHQKNKSKYTFLISQYNNKFELFRLLAYKIEEYKIIYDLEPPLALKQIIVQCLIICNDKTQVLLKKLSDDASSLYVKDIKIEQYKKIADESIHQLNNELTLNYEAINKIPKIFKKNKKDVSR